MNIRAILIISSLIKETARMKFLYWNLHRNPSIQDCLVALIREQEPDIAIFSEWKLNEAEFRFQINQFSVPKYEKVFSPIQKRSPFIISKYPKNIIEKASDITSGCICRIKPLYDSVFLLFSFHFPSKLFKKPDDYILFSQRIARKIENVEEREGHRRSIVVGDLNMNPFEAGMVAGDCFHALMDKKIVVEKSRIVDGEKRFFFFYNPMWSRFGDDTPGPSGSYYYDSGGQVNQYWNMFDQVIVRPDLVDCFNNDSLKIVTTAGSYKLLKPSGFPDSDQISDHLPIVFEINVKS